MSLRFHEIAEADHRILDPLGEDEIRLVGTAADVRPGTRILDLCCGKGEMLCRWAEWFGSGGVGVDLSRVFLSAARARASELGVADRVSFVEAEAAAHARSLAAPTTGGAGWDVVACIGATWIGGGLTGTLELMRPLVRPAGTLLVGEVFYEEPPPAEALTAWGFEPDDYASLAGTADRLAAAGLELVELVAADRRTWERYEAAQWRAVVRWLDGHPDDPERDEIRGAMEASRVAYLAWGRRYLGWAVFVTRVVG